MHLVKNCIELQQNYCFLNLQAPKNKNYMCNMQNPVCPVAVLLFSHCF